MLCEILKKFANQNKKFRFDSIKNVNTFQRFNVVSSFMPLAIIRKEEDFSYKREIHEKEEPHSASF